ncbi:histidine phosphatase family protein [Bowmanella sp. Y26]|uniref:SixA phosphatase family protein n=1 Tax=Bowmanella yangjiangensis TaxID=2811230 RepID=UPI001BDD0738|nr:phosphoglycerate mutase family protein [Bowmanella yangjiangensis]MBT1062820.1 histidine phosphatase family protein [Bowmanella yangjiangensis]
MRWMLVMLSLLCSQFTLAEEYSLYLLRHAEKQSAQGKDPGLSEPGLQRAKALGQLLANVPLRHIYSTDYQRTKQTVAPLAEVRHLTVELYAPDELPALAAKLTAQGKDALVVGHSNTTPQLLKLLGAGDMQMNESNYGDLYQLNIKGDNVRLIPLRIPAL